jgi:integrase
VFRFQVPSLCRHKEKNLSYVRGPAPERRFHYLGETGHPDTMIRYREFAAAFIARGGWPEGFFAGEKDTGPTVGDLVKSFRAEMQDRRGGWDSYTEMAASLLEEVYGYKPIGAFNGRDLQTGYRFLAKSGKYNRLTCNKSLGACKRLFRYGVMIGMVSPETFAQIEAVEGIRKNEIAELSESTKRMPVSEDVVRETLSFMPPVLQAALWTLWYSGARPSEVLTLRVKDVLRTGEIWTATLSEHKTASAGRSRVLHFGKQAQVWMGPYLLQPPDSIIFSPKQAVKERAAACKVHRREKQKPNKKKTARTLNDYYGSRELGRAVERAIEACNEKRKEEGREPIPHWTPYMMRHSAASRVREQFGLDGAQALLGHSSVGITEVYAHLDNKKAAEIALALG